MRATSASLPRPRPKAATKQEPDELFSDPRTNRGSTALGSR
jgi:hypothetical protein